MVPYVLELHHKMPPQFLVYHGHGDWTRLVLQEVSVVRRLQLHLQVCRDRERERERERDRGVTSEAVQESLTFYGLALDQVEIVASSEDPRAETPHKALQVAVVHVENVLVHGPQTKELFSNTEQQL